MNTLLRDWENLLECCANLLQYSVRCSLLASPLPLLLTICQSNRILQQDGDIPRDLLRSLTRSADLVGYLESTYSNLHKYIYDTVTYPQLLWMLTKSRRVLHANALTANDSRALVRINQKENELSKKTDTLIQRVCGALSVSKTLSNFIRRRTLCLSTKRISPANRPPA